jgi:hypothetical protein
VPAKVYKSDSLKKPHQNKLIEWKTSYRAFDWKLLEEKVKELQRSCVTQIYKQNFHLQ